jgi:hypothetical protein
MPPCPRALAVLSLLALTACNAFQDRSEFAAPQSRWKDSEPSSVKADAAPPPIPEQYCYRTLATVDCFAHAVPDRITGYTGLYPDPASLPPGSDPAAAQTANQQAKQATSQAASQPPSQSASPQPSQPASQQAKQP